MPPKLSKASNVWEHFEDLNPDSSATGRKSVQCNVCKKHLTVVQKSTSTMWNHLQRYHPRVFTTATEARRTSMEAKKAAAEDDSSDDETHGGAGDKEPAPPGVAGDDLEFGFDLSQSQAQPQPGSSSQGEKRKNLGEPSKNIGEPSKKKKKEEDQPSIRSSMKKLVPYEKDHPRQKKFDKVVTFYLAVDNHSFRSVDGRGFKALVNNLDPRITIKSRHSYSRDRLESLYQEVKVQVDEELNKSIKMLTGIAFTSDMWTSRNNQAYMSITAHFINQDWKLKSFLVGMKPFDGSHTGAALAVEMDASVDKLELQENVMTQRWCVTDRGANVLMAVRLSVELDKNMYCMDHTIHLIVTKAVKDTAILQEAMDQCGHLASHFHRSTKHNDLLRKKCAELAIPYKKIVLPCKTRWNSQFLSLRSILDLQPALLALGEEVTEVGRLMPSSMCLETVASSAPILEKFFEASVTFSAEKVVTIHKVVASFFRIEAFLNKIIRSNAGFKDFALALLKQMEHYVPNAAMEKDEFAIAHLLDPTLKGVAFRKSEATVERLVDILAAASDEIDRFLDPRGSQPQQSSSGDEAVEAVEEDDDPLFAAVRDLAQRHPGIAPTRTNTSGPSEIRSELDRYLQTPMALKDTNILSWWKGMAQDQFPKLARLARRYLCIPAGSTASERVFSDAGNVVTWTRQNLKSDNVEKLVYIKENSKCVNIKL